MIIDPNSDPLRNENCSEVETLTFDFRLISCTAVLNHYCKFLLLRKKAARAADDFSATAASWDYPSRELVNQHLFQNAMALVDSTPHGCGDIVRGVHCVFPYSSLLKLLENRIQSHHAGEPRLDPGPALPTPFNSLRGFTGIHFGLLFPTWHSPGIHLNSLRHINVGIH